MNELEGFCGVKKIKKMSRREFFLFFLSRWSGVPW